MKKIIKILIAVFLIIVIGSGLAYFILNDNGDTRVTNDKAEKDTEGRYLTLINNTNQVVNEVYVAVGNGTEIEHGYQNNPDENSFSIEIPKDYSEYDTFIVTFIDRYELKYEKEVTGVKEKGRTEVVVTEKDYVKQKGDLKRKIDKFFNGD